MDTTSGKLVEHKTKTRHYFIDAQGLKQGEYKYYFINGQLRAHCFTKDDKTHGEYKNYYDDGQLAYHCIDVDGKEIELPDSMDINNLSDEDKGRLIEMYGQMEFLN